MLALSTSWQSSETATAAEMIAAFKSLGINAIELSYRISEAMFRQLQELLKRSGIKVVSVHNYFPIPSVRLNVKASGDLFLLSSLDGEERRDAIRFTKKTIETAAELEARAVVLHCGAVEMNHEMHALYQFFHTNRLGSVKAQTFIRNKLKERDRLKSRHISRLLSSLDHLTTIAEERGVLLGLENRYHYHELPGFDDFSIIFDTFKGAPLGYWHDAGHAHANEVLGLIPKNALLHRFADQLIGVHLHDAVGLDDHIPPGSGEINYSILKSCLKKTTIKVIELKPGISNTEVLKGIQYVAEVLLN
ncbi:MAG: TIM barrel protein [Desulfobacterales bacterium]